MSPLKLLPVSALLAVAFLSAEAHAASAYQFRVNAPGVVSAVKAPVKASIVQAGASRTWSDGTVAKNCLDYLTGDATHGYSGTTGDGVYRIQPTGSSAFDATCDMTSDAGGWTLVYSATPAAATSYVSFLSSATLSNTVSGSALRFARQMGAWYGQICTFPTGVTSLATLATQPITPYNNAVAIPAKSSTLYPTAYGYQTSSCRWMVTDGSSNTTISQNTEDTYDILTTDSRSTSGEVDYDMAVGQSEGAAAGRSSPQFDGLGGIAPMMLWVR